MDLRKKMWTTIRRPREKTSIFPTLRLPRRATRPATAQLQQSMRNSRIDFLAKTNVDGWMTKGYLEGDFLGASNTPRSQSLCGSDFPHSSRLSGCPKGRMGHHGGPILDPLRLEHGLCFGVRPTPADHGDLLREDPRIGVMKTMGDDRTRSKSRWMPSGQSNPFRLPERGRGSPFRVE